MKLFDESVIDCLSNVVNQVKNNNVSVLIATNTKKDKERIVTYLSGFLNQCEIKRVIVSVTND